MLNCSSTAAAVRRASARRALIRASAASAAPARRAWWRPQIGPRSCAAVPAAAPRTSCGPHASQSDRSSNASRPCLPVRSATGRRCLTVGAATPRGLERGRPHADAGLPSLVLGGDIAMRVPAVGERQALGDQPFVDVDLADETAADDPPVAVDIALVTGDGAPANQVLQRQGCPLAAAPFLAGRIQAGLAALRRVDAVQPDALAMESRSCRRRSPRRRRRSLRPPVPETLRPVRERHT